MSEQLKQKTIKVLGIGDALVDLSTQAAQLPPRGGNIWSTAVQLSPGGTTANVAANLSKLGIESAFIGCVGGDPYGHYIIDEFNHVGVQTAGMIIRPGVFTGIILAIIDMEGGTHLYRLRQRRCSYPIAG
jgi:fructokinase